MADYDPLDESESKKKKLDTNVIVVRNIMKTTDGRLYMWEKLQSCHVFETIFTEDPIKHAFKSGLREFGVQLNREIKEFAPGDYIKMIEENIDG